LKKESLSSNKITKIKLFIIVAFLFIVFYFLTIYLPGFSGKVIDSKTGKPIKDAYVICFTELRPFKYFLALSLPDSIHGTKTDAEGRFRINNYFKFYPGILGLREIYIYKKDYYALRSLQKNKLHITEYHFLDLPHREKRELHFFRINNFNLHKDLKEINNVNGMLAWTGWFSGYFLSENEEQYISLKPFFMELYNYFSSNSEQIKQTLKRKHIIDNWESDLESLKRNLRLDE
jgi:hypothetical protein